MEARRCEVVRRRREAVGGGRRWVGGGGRQWEAVGGGWRGALVRSELVWATNCSATIAVPPPSPSPSIATHQCHRTRCRSLRTSPALLVRACICACICACISASSPSIFRTSAIWGIRGDQGRYSGRHTGGVREVDERYTGDQGRYTGGPPEGRVLKRCRSCVHGTRPMHKTG